MNLINKIKLYFFAHKIISSVILIVVVFVGYSVFKKVTSTAGDTRYITTKVTTGSIVSSVSGSGQVSASNKIDIQPKASGDVVYVAVQNGQKVAAGALIAQLDNKDAQKAVRDAQTSLEAAKIALQKQQIQESSGNLNADLTKAYNDGFNAVSSTFIDLPSTVASLNDMFGEVNLSDNAARTNGHTAEDYRNTAETSYYAVYDASQTNQKDYRIVSHDSPAADLEKIINETYTTTTLLSDAIKDMRNFVDYMAQNNTQSSAFNTDKNNLSSYTSTVNSHLDALLSAQTTIKNDKDAFSNSDLDLQSSNIGITEKENALQDAKDKLADYFIRAPFAGTIAVVNVKKSDSVSSGTVVATIITDQQVAEISLNEVDVAKIQIGEKATLTFDAIPDLTISGIVSEIDSVGTVSQGVVTYIVKINFDTQDARVKPAMSVSAAIVTNVKENILMLPNSAIKSQNGTSYVQVFDGPLPAPTDGSIGSISKIAPTNVPVEIGVANDTDTEIVSGLKEGDGVVSRIILPSATPTTAAPSLFGAAPATRGGGGAARFGR